ncbi:hypothetical protein, partial [Streptomyces sp. NPDC056132]|uniref:hypothetical protein n=1 Tax=Streptomyces sp. NPDC056132 TaxID=3345722 RepID=UPI0035DF9E87
GSLWIRAFDVVPALRRHRCAVLVGLAGGGEGIEVPAGDRGRREEEAGGGEVGLGQVVFEGSEVVSAQARVGGVGVVAEVAVGEPGGGSQ